MKILLLSPYHGGSHQAWAEGYRQYSKHEISLLTMPARFWKWRMHGGAMTLARLFLAQSFEPDLFLATDMVDLTSFLALTRQRSSRLAVVLYLHENQLTYPLPENGNTGPMRRQLGERDQHYAFINFVSMSTADAIYFNSSYHQHSFFAALPNFLKHFPDFNELDQITLLREKSKVLPLGIDLQRLQDEPAALSDHTVPMIIWNQRWEYDKQPEVFFAALYALAERGVPFRLALCGEQFGKRPLPFEEALQKLAAQIVHVGYADPLTYRALLREATVTVSTAIHEYFGISIVEAIYAHTFPILPRRLSYPELIPEKHHHLCLYDTDDELVARLQQVLTEPGLFTAVTSELVTAVAKYDWSKMAPIYDQQMETAHTMSQFSRK